MSIKDKKRILTDYYRKHGGLPKGNLDIDADTDTVGNVFVDDSVIVLFQTPTPALDNSTEIQYNKGCIFRRFP